jgi:hypothetical protein
MTAAATIRRIRIRPAKVLNHGGCAAVDHPHPIPYA